MTVPHDEATAKVTIDGLAICCFDRTDKTWDLAFLHHPNPPPHRLILQVEGHPPRNLSSKREIRFETEGGNFPSGFPDGFSDNGRIRDRTMDLTMATLEEKENFRWTMDLEDPLDVDHGFLGLRKPPFTLTRAFIQNAVFYTTQHSPRDLILLPDGRNPNTEPDPPIFGKTNDEIAADIFCEDGGEVVIFIDNDEHLRLPHREGNPWRICLTHMCRDLPPPTMRFEKGDFHLFYDVLVFSKDRHLLWGEPLPGIVHCDPFNEHGFLRDRESGRTDCDTVRLGERESLEDLF